MHFKHFLANSPIDKNHIKEFLKDFQGRNIYIPKTIHKNTILKKYDVKLIEELIKEYGGRTIYVNKIDDIENFNNTTNLNLKISVLDIFDNLIQKYPFTETELMVLKTLFNKKL